MFYPVPNVDSAVVRIDICPPKHGVTDLTLYRKTVRAAFLSRRKTLANNLMQAFGMTRQVAEEVISLAGIDVKARGETLSTEAFARLSGVIAKYKK
jgi:16S rRNA (adenine1518-N6/adenine1519-N6)-dimethyltransferase